jgi:hypothetical protein
MPLLATQRDSPHPRPGVVGQIWRPGDSLAAGKDDRHEVRAWQCRTASWVKSSLGVVRARLAHSHDSATLALFARLSV